MAAPDQLGIAPKRLSGLTATASTTFSGWPASALFDDIVGTSGNAWSATVASPGWVQAQTAAPETVTSYKVTARTDAANSCPSAWTFEGSPDGTAWTTLDTQTGQTWTAGYGRTYTFANSTAYSYYRLNITATQGGGATLPSFTEWSLYAGTAASLLDWWKADAITSVTDGTALPATSIPDSSGNAHTFSTSARTGLYRATSGPSGKPFIDGSTTSGFAYSGASTAAPSGDLSYFAVVRTPSSGVQSIIGSVNSGGAQLRVNNYNVQLDRDGVATIATSTLSLLPNSWTIIIATYSKDTGTFTLNLQGSTETVSGVVAANFTNPGALNLGSYRGALTNLWLGGIAEVGRYTSVLSGADQAALYSYLFNKYFTGPVLAQVENHYLEAMAVGTVNAQIETHFLEAMVPVLPLQVESAYTEAALTTTPSIQAQSSYLEVALLGPPPPITTESSYLEVLLVANAIQRFVGWGSPR